MFAVVAKRDASIGIRTKAWIRDALLDEAAKEERSVSWLVERITADWLRGRGYEEPRSCVAGDEARARAGRTRARKSS